MDISSRKLAVIENIIETQDEMIIAVIEKLLNGNYSSEDKELSKEEFIANIEESMADYYAGKYKSANDLLKDFEDS